MEIERKFLVRQLPSDLDSYPVLQIEQAYLNRDPVVRVRQENENYYMTYKGRGLIAREEYNLPLNAGSYEHLKAKADGNVITKRRYLIPVAPYTAELDMFEGVLEGLCVVEVEFETLQQAEDFTPPAWFGRDVTKARSYQNSVLSAADPEQIRLLIEETRQNGEEAQGE